MNSRIAKAIGRNKFAAKETIRHFVTHLTIPEGPLRKGWPVLGNGIGR